MRQPLVIDKANKLHSMPALHAAAFGERSGQETRKHLHRACARMNG